MGMVDASDIEEEYSVEGVLVNGPRGMVRVLKAYRTVPMPVWRLVAGGYGIECSHSHLVGTPCGFVEARLLKPGDTVLVRGGEAVVEESAATGRVESLYDITVDDDSGEFYSNGVLSHNSTSFCSRQLTYSCVLPGYRSLYVTPYFEQLSTYGERMFDMEGLVRYDAGKQNKYLKKYPNGSKIWMSYACESADQIRGKTVSEVLVDECVSEDVSIVCRRDKKSVATVVRICDAVVGSWVLCPVLGTDKTTYGRITDKQCKGERECWTVCTERGYTVTATANHKLRSGDRWVRVADILRDIGVHSLVEGDPNGGQGSDEPFRIKSAYTCDDIRNTVGRREHSESGETRLLQTYFGGSQRGPERVCGCEDANVEHAETVMAPRSKQGLWEGEYDLSFFNYYVRGIGPVLEPVLQQAGSFTGWSCADAEVCIASLGGPVVVGSGGLVDSGRRRIEWKVLQHFDAFFFGRGSGEVGSMVQETRTKQTRSCGYEACCAAWIGRSVSGYTIFDCSFTEGCGKDSPVCTSFYGVQVGSRVTVSGLCLPGLWCRVSSCKKDVGSAEVLQRRSLPGVQEAGNEGQQAPVQGACRYRGDAQALARREARDGGEGQKVCPGILQAQQRCDCGEAQGDQSRILPNAQGGNMREGAGEVSREGKIETLWVLHDGKLVEDRIAHVAYAGRQRVWDITVEPGHTFMGNSVVNSNCQNMNPALLPEILKTQQMSKFPMTIYSGTALDTETLLEQRWQMSSKGCFHVRSHDGRHWINLHDEEELWKVCSNPMGPVDYWTGKPLDVTNGVFVHENMQALEQGDVGLHIPMIIVPSNCSGTQWAQIYSDISNENIPRKKVLQEVFGIAVGEGAREVTEDDLKAICVLTDGTQAVLRKIREGKYRTVVMGCDWGGSDYNRASGTKQSYTAVAILGLTFANKVEILWAKKYAGMEYRTIVGDFVGHYKEFGCRAIASDYGGGAVYTMLIRDHIPWTRHYIMQYDSPWCAPFKAANSELANHYAVNRTEAVTNTFMDIKDGRLQAGPWAEMRPFLTDILAVRRVISEQPSGKKYMLWQRDSTRPDDFLHALTFGLTLIKVYLGERVVADRSVLAQIRGVMNGNATPSGLQGMPPVISG